ncbi:MAG: hypothetical protein IPM29_15625 [Planctomycetes bacterium]|nr:hypothetical protein [Planctomycetota bacterium]
MFGISFRPALAGVLLIAVATSAATAQDRGIQLIGAARASNADIDFVAAELSAAPHSVQVSALPFEFAPAAPFTQLDRLVRSVLPNKARGRLRIVVYGRWFPHDARGNANQAEFWDAWTARRPTAAQTAIRDGYLLRVRQYTAWVGATRNWATSVGLLDRVRFTFVPVLEDTCTSAQSAGYARLLAAVAQQQAADGSGSTQFRRSCLTANAYRVAGATLELHGTWGQVRGLLRSGDAWSNDGTDYLASDFVRDQGSARATGVDVLYWDQLYNGTPRERSNWAERTVNPFTGPRRAVKRADLRLVIRS